MSDHPAPQAAGRSLGPALIVFGALALGLAQGIPESSLGSNQDPGPRAFPVALAALLVVGGVYELLRAVLLHRRHATDSTPTSWAPDLRGFFRQRENRDVLILLGALGLYLALLPWLGFPLSTVLFASGMLLRLGTRWPWALGVALGLVLIIHLLFVLLFKVQLPPGVLGLSW